MGQAWEEEEGKEWCEQKGINRHCLATTEKNVFHELVVQEPLEIQYTYFFYYLLILIASPKVLMLSKLSAFMYHLVVCIHFLKKYHFILIMIYLGFLSLIFHFGGVVQDFIL